MQRENLMLSDVEECNNLMLTRLTPVATLFAIAIEIKNARVLHAVIRTRQLWSVVPLLVFFH